MNKGDAPLYYRNSRGVRDLELKGRVPFISILAEEFRRLRGPDAPDALGEPIKYEG